MTDYQHLYESEAALSFQMNTGAVMVPPFDDSKKYMIEPDQTYEPHIQVSMPLQLKSKVNQLGT